LASVRIMPAMPASSWWGQLFTRGWQAAAWQPVRQV